MLLQLQVFQVMLQAYNISSDVTSLANSLEKTYVVTVANVGGTNVFVLDSVNNPAIEMFRGNKYIFNVSDSSVSGHPLAFKDGSGNSFTTGVTTSGTAGTSGATVTFEVPSTAPNSCGIIVQVIYVMVIQFQFQTYKSRCF